MKTRSRLDISLLFLLIALIGFLAICVFYLVHNAHWMVGDEAIVIFHTGMGKAFSPLGFDGMVTSYGRLYPLAYSLYNVLLLFYKGYVPPSAIYTLHGIALVILSVAFLILALRILRDIARPWQCATAFFFVVICVFRVYTEFITCYTGVWIVYLFLPIFLLFSCRFMENEKWVDGIIALLAINYINYCYETVFTIPLAIGMCSLIFNYKKMTPKKRLFSWLLTGSGILFLLIYAVVVLPNAHSFYQHYGTTTFIGNTFKMFFANKIYWFASVVLIIRLIEIVFKKKPYTFYDSLLLASFAYFLGAAVLKLNYTYYYNIGALIGLTASLYFLKNWMKPQWVCLIMLAFAIFYGRKIPGVIQSYQKARVDTFKEMTTLSTLLDEGENLFWYEPPYEGDSPSYLDLRETSKVRIEVYLSWMKQHDVSISGQPFFDGSKGVWLVYPGNDSDVPEIPSGLAQNSPVFSTSGIVGYQCE